MRTFVAVFVGLTCILTLTPPAAAQSTHAAPPSAIDQALQQHVDSADADRALVQRVLEQPVVRALAAELGLDVRRAQSAIATLQGEQLTRLAAQAHLVEQALAGGQSRITISTTLIIIALLVLILLIVALD
jgi:pyruvate/2-oxoglutarate dehydrogenase complex dihydrolipoamide acyltransferase (E2) component